MHRQVGANILLALDKYYLPLPPRTRAKPIRFTPGDRLMGLGRGFMTRMLVQLQLPCLFRVTLTEMTHVVLGSLQLLLRPVSARRTRLWSHEAWLPALGPDALLHRLASVGHRLTFSALSFLHRVDIPALCVVVSTQG